MGTQLLLRNREMTTFWLKKATLEATFLGIIDPDIPHLNSPLTQVWL
jgi:hypothetical protein